MHHYSIAGIEIEREIEEANLTVEESWTAEEIERIFNLDDQPPPIGHAELDELEPEGPNYFLVGGPFGNYNQS